jgi:hypothetical protein
MPKSLPSAKETAWRQTVDKYASDGRPAKEFFHIRAISLRMYVLYRR